VWKSELKLTILFVSGFSTKKLISSEGMTLRFVSEETIFRRFLFRVPVPEEK